MSGSSPTGSPAADAKPAWWLWLVIGAVLVALTLIIVLVAVRLPSGGSAADPASGSSPTPSASESTPPDPSPVPSASADEVPIDDPATIKQGVTAQLDRIEAVDGKAKGPGEVSGPAVRFRVSIINDTDKKIDLSATVVTVDYGDDRTPALELFEPGASPLPDSVAPGDTATAVYIFTVPVDERDLVHITVDYTVGVPPIEFVGSVPTH